MSYLLEYIGHKDKQWKSRFKKLDTIELPQFSNTRVLMLPILMEDIESLPNDLSHYKKTVEDLIKLSPAKEGIAYLTIDEKVISSGKSHRLKGLHIDGMGTDGRMDLGIWAISGITYRCNEHWNDEDKRWYHNAAGLGGMITVSNPAGCRAWDKDFDGRINRNGDCEELREIFPDNESTIFEANTVYWCNSMCVHESVPVVEDTERIFARLSMPSYAPWYEGYTMNPKGIKPAGPIIPRQWCNNTEEEIVLKG